MLKIEREQRKLLSLTCLAPGSLSERHDLRELVLNSPAEFLGEMREKLFLIASDVEPPSGIEPRIDVLALDQTGRAVVVLVQSGTEQPPLARSITCAAMVASCDAESFLRRLPGERAKDLKRFLQVESSEINRKQRVILAAESFDGETLAAAKYLRDLYGLDVACVQVSMAAETLTNTEYLFCENLSEDSQAASGLPALNVDQGASIESRII